MKAYKMTDLLKKDAKTLNEDMAKLNSQLTDLKIKATTRKMSDDSSEAKKVKKNIARIQTAFNAPKEVKPVKSDDRKSKKEEKVKEK
ncbi:MAG: 50S ribosomal protein L29 [Candidatus Nomurabacteria bacterium]|nr:MAG: 50S ribosomal protein L29 [Candidatus Nomurabacteria bacterium]HRV76179.1 50S ribosomal protein L29 [Candidatus Saccharimonadales bacterium]